jgi:hypothetical protein
MGKANTGLRSEAVRLLVAKCNEAINYFSQAD